MHLKANRKDDVYLSTMILFFNDLLVRFVNDDSKSVVLFNVRNKSGDCFVLKICVLNYRENNDLIKISNERFKKLILLYVHKTWTLTI